jgi:hypothetical protein
MNIETIRTASSIVDPTTDNYFRGSVNEALDAMVLVGA